MVSFAKKSGKTAAKSGIRCQDGMPGRMGILAMAADAAMGILAMASAAMGEDPYPGHGDPGHGGGII